LLYYESEYSNPWFETAWLFSYLIDSSEDLILRCIYASELVLRDLGWLKVSILFSGM